MGAMEELKMFIWKGWGYSRESFGMMSSGIFCQSKKKRVNRFAIRNDYVGIMG